MELEGNSVPLVSTSAQISKEEEEELWGRSAVVAEVEVGTHEMMGLKRKRKVEAEARTANQKRDREQTDAQTMGKQRQGMR